MHAHTSTQCSYVVTAFTTQIQEIGSLILTCQRPKMTYKSEGKHNRHWQWLTVHNDTTLNKIIGDVHHVNTKEI